MCQCFNVKQTLTEFCVNWRIIPLTGLLSLIREVMQRGLALLICTLSALSGQVPAHHVGPIYSRRVMLSKSDAGSGRWLVSDLRLTTSKDPHSALIDRAMFSVPLMLAHATHQGVGLYYRSTISSI